MNTDGQLPDDQRKPVLEELEAEVEADLALIANSRPDDAAAPETPDRWLDDPEEVQVEETDLRSLLGAVQALEAEPPRDAD
jgi:hypothetical protein